MSDAIRGWEATLEIEDILGAHGAAGTFYPFTNKSEFGDDYANNNEDSTVCGDAGFESHKLVSQGRTISLSYTADETDPIPLQILREMKAAPFTHEGFKIRTTEPGQAAVTCVAVIGENNISYPTSGIITGSATFTRDGANI